MTNHYIVNATTREIWADVPEPEGNAEDYELGSHWNLFWFDKWQSYNSRPHYPYSTELNWIDGQRVEEGKDFVIKEPMWGSSASFPAPIAIPLAQYKQPEIQPDIAKEEAIKKILENSNGSWVDMITEGYEAGQTSQTNTAIPLPSKDSSSFETWPILSATILGDKEEKTERETASILPEGDGEARIDLNETFEDYMRNSRNEFVNFIWDNFSDSVVTRLAAENILICFDQMRERLLSAPQPPLTPDIETAAKEYGK